MSSRAALVGGLLSIVVAAPTSARAQDKAPSAAAVAASTDPRDTELPQWTGEQATAAIAAFKNAWREAKAPEAKLAAVDGLVKGRHSFVADELAKLIKEKDATLRLRAVTLIGTQQGVGAEKHLLPLCKYARNYDTARGRAAIRSLGYIGYGKDGYKVLEDLFWKCADPELRADLAFAWGKQKEKRAFSILVAMLDMPRPVDPNDPNNPPASYWEAIGKQWEVVKGPTGVALEQICGKKMFNKDAAERWFEDVGKKQGFKLERVEAVFKA